jgi:hypothetical protein
MVMINLGNHDAKIPPHRPLANLSDSFRYGNAAMLGERKGNEIGAHHLGVHEFRHLLSSSFDLSCVNNIWTCRCSGAAPGALPGQVSVRYALPFSQLA